MMTLTVEYYFTHPQDKLGMYASDPEDNSQEHGHEFAELVIVEEGHGLHVINGRPLYIQQTYFTSSLAMSIIMMSWGR
jgi:AraC family L-rhamnose operon regulatory protein RhaS